MWRLRLRADEGREARRETLVSFRIVYRPQVLRGRVRVGTGLSQRPVLPEAAFEQNSVTTFANCSGSSYIGKCPELSK
jgi:hypothetical protein